KLRLVRGGATRTIGQKAQARDRMPNPSPDRRRSGETTLFTLNSIPLTGDRGHAAPSNHRWVAVVRGCNNTSHVNPIRLLVFGASHRTGCDRRRLTSLSDYFF